MRRILLVVLIVLAFCWRPRITSTQTKTSGKVKTTGNVSTVPPCPSKTFSFYLTLPFCQQEATIYKWTGYSCSGTASVCTALGTNGSSINFTQDYNGPASILVGRTTAWNVTGGAGAARQTVDVVMSGFILGATRTQGSTVNGTWPHWCAIGQPGCSAVLTGVYGSADNGQYEENIVTVGCAATGDCTNSPVGGGGASDILCNFAVSTGVQCNEQTGIGPFSFAQATFHTSTSTKWYPLTIEVKMDGGSASCAGMNFGNYCASLQSVGVHILE